MKTNKIKKCLWISALCLFVIFVLQGCSIFSDRTTSVYGTITDENGQPIDSIEVEVYGGKLNGFYHMATTLSDSTGHYEIVLEVAGKFTKLECLIPPNSSGNVKYQNGYSGYEIFKDGKSAGFSIEKGEKNNVDFHLKTK